MSEIAAQPDECYNRVLQMTLPWMNSQSYLGGSVIGQESSLYTDIGRQTVVAKGAGGKGEVAWEVGVDQCKLLYIG